MKNQDISTITDIDGNVYNTIKIGSQIWMKENLKVTRFSNGDIIPIKYFIDGYQWHQLRIGAYCDYLRGPNNITYGKLYNGYAVVDERNIAPLGWHIPSPIEWENLADFMDGEREKHHKLWGERLVDWKVPIASLKNGMRFNDSFGGSLRYLVTTPEDYYYDSIKKMFPRNEAIFSDLLYQDIGKVGNWWSCLETNSLLTKHGIVFSMTEADEMLYFSLKQEEHFSSGLSVRCIKDYPSIDNKAGNNDNDLEVADIDGNRYKTITIGNQVWMTENLRVEHYRNGDSIYNYDRKYLDNESFCADFDDLISNSQICGKLYNGFTAIDNRKIAPSGWHVPTNFDIFMLTIFLGGKNWAGGKLKIRGTDFWSKPNYGATNESGFSALPTSADKNSSDSSRGQWWCSTKKMNLTHRERKHRKKEYWYGYTIISSFYLTKWDSKLLKENAEIGSRALYSIRCIKDFNLFDFLLFWFSSLFNLLKSFFAKKIIISKDKSIIEWVTIPAGDFKMWYDNDWKSFQELEMKEYKISKYPITFEQYDMFCDETGRKKPKDNNYGRGNRAVFNVSWHDATAFANWVGCRLPTEAEWEYACRTGNRDKLYVKKSDVDYYEHSKEVGYFPPNSWDIYDMHRSVRSWCSDWYFNDSFIYKDPHKPNNIRLSKCGRSLRGGIFGDSFIAAIKGRSNEKPNCKKQTTGIRLVTDL